MKFIVAIVLFIGVSTAAPGTPDADAFVKSQESEIAPDHSSFKHGYSTSNGISAQEQGLLRQPKTVEETAAYETQGQYQYVGPDNIVYAVRYTAGVGGFQPEVRINYLFVYYYLFVWKENFSGVSCIYSEKNLRSTIDPLAAPHAIKFKIIAKQM